MATLCIWLPLSCWSISVADWGERIEFAYQTKSPYQTSDCIMYLGTWEHSGHFSFILCIFPFGILPAPASPPSSLPSIQHFLRFPFATPFNWMFCQFVLIQGSPFFFGTLIFSKRKKKKLTLFHIHSLTSPVAWISLISLVFLAKKLYFILGCCLFF